MTQFVINYYYGDQYIWGFTYKDWGNSLHCCEDWRNCQQGTLYLASAQLLFVILEISSTSCGNHLVCNCQLETKQNNVLWNAHFLDAPFWSDMFSFIYSSSRLQTLTVRSGQIWISLHNPLPEMEWNTQHALWYSHHLPTCRPSGWFPISYVILRPSSKPLLFPVPAPGSCGIRFLQLLVNLSKNLEELVSHIRAVLLSKV